MSKLNQWQTYCHKTIKRLEESQYDLSTGQSPCLFLLSYPSLASTLLFFFFKEKTEKEKIRRALNFLLFHYSENVHSFKGHRHSCYFPCIFLKDEEGHS